MIKTEVQEFLGKILGVEEVEVQESQYADFVITPAEIARLNKTYNLNLDADKIIGILQSNFNKDLFDETKTQSRNGFVNLALSRTVLNSEIARINESLTDYLATPNPEKTVIIDYSGPNIAKPFSVGHLRSTVIGQANYNIHKALGYKTIGINHIGDWGTQFGKLIYATKTWGDEVEIAKDPINELVKLYQKFHEEAEENPELNQEAAEWFRKLELHDQEAERLWQKCIKWSFNEFDRLYTVLGVKIDYTTGESFYADKTDEIIQELRQKGLLKESQGAQIVELDAMPPVIIQKTNESTLYVARDLAAIKYRIETFDPDEIIYHVGNDQSLHFRQLFEVAFKLGWTSKVKFTFAGHGMMRLPEGKMSTRKGRTVLLDDLLQEAKRRVEILSSQKDKTNVDGKEMDLAVSAVKYADLASNRQSDVVFSFDRLIDLRGNSAIYLQYTYARIESLVREYKLRHGEEQKSTEFNQEAEDLIRHGILIKRILIRSAQSSSPNILCEFVYTFANKFNAFYEKNRIITNDKNESALNMLPVYFARNIIGFSLELLGLKKFEEI